MFDEIEELLFNNRALDSQLIAEDLIEARPFT